MSARRFTPKCKEEAFRQVAERGYCVAEVEARLRVSTYSLYQWVKAVLPPEDEKQAAELVDAMGEILRLHAPVQRLEQERDLLKKPRGTTPSSLRKVRFMNGHRKHYSLVLMCRVLKVARAGFYQWLHKLLSDRAIED